MSIQYSPSEIYEELIRPDMDRIVNSNNLVCYTKDFRDGVLNLSLWPKPDTPTEQGKHQQCVHYSVSSIFSLLISPDMDGWVGPDNLISYTKYFENGVLTLSLWPATHYSH